MKTLYFLVLSLAFLSNSINAQKAFEQELRALLERFRELVVNGWPEKNVPVLDPYYMEYYDFELAVPGIMPFDMQFYNLTSTGLKDFIVNSVSYNIFAMRLDYNLSIPLLSLFADRYNLNDRNDSNWHGQGKFDVAAVNLTIAGAGKFKIDLRGIKMTNFSISIRMDKFKSNIDGLMDDEEMTIFLNQVFQQIVAGAVVAQEERINNFIEPRVVEFVNSLLDQFTTSDVEDFAKLLNWN